MEIRHGAFRNAGNECEVFREISEGQEGGAGITKSKQIANGNHANHHHRRHFARSCHRRNFCFQQVGEKQKSDAGSVEWNGRFPQKEA
jgi:hypothetical protein